ncbi:MAG: type VI secretion system ATPase TssH, partial [Desulfovibrio sp.]|nr:type VI secretion system ATPase TssH [Desulfovibrio sp.]
MLNMNLGALVAALDAQARAALEEAAALCVSRGGHEVGVEDFVENLIETQDVQDILAQFGIALDAVRRQLLKRPQGKGGASGRPVFSPLLIELLQEAWLLASLELGHGSVGGQALMLALLLNPARYSVMGFYRELGKIPADELKRLLEGLSSAGGGATSSSAPQGESNLKKFSIDFTEEARQGSVDPVFARGPELHQIIDILTRRRKNNPI